MQSMQIGPLGIDQCPPCLAVHSSLFECPLCANRWAEFLGCVGEQDDMVTALVELPASRESHCTYDFHAMRLCCGGRDTAGAQVRAPRPGGGQGEACWRNWNLNPNQRVGSSPMGRHCCPPRGNTLEGQGEFTVLVKEPEKT